MNLPALSPHLAGYITLFGWFVGAYLVGSIPEAWLITRWVTGKDLRDLGSGNVGVMNTALSVTRWAGLLVFLTEVLKGILAVILPRLVGAGTAAQSLCVIGIVLGVRWPVFLAFKGGRANSAGFAALTTVSALSAVVLLVFWYFMRILIKSSYRASRLTMLVIPLIVFLTTSSWEYTITGGVLSAIYLTAQQPKTDDHLRIKRQSESFWKFLKSPPRDHHMSTRQ